MSRDPTVSLSVKGIQDNECLHMWQCTTEIKADPVAVLMRLRMEQHLWKMGLVRWHIVERVNDNCDVFYSVANIPGHREEEPREFCQLRCEFSTFNFVFMMK